MATTKLSPLTMAVTRVLVIHLWFVRPVTVDELVRVLVEAVVGQVHQPVGQVGRVRAVLFSGKPEEEEELPPPPNLPPYVCPDMMKAERCFHARLTWLAPLGTDRSSAARH